MYVAYIYTYRYKLNYIYKANKAKVNLIKYWTYNNIYNITKRYYLLFVVVCDQWIVYGCINCINCNNCIKEKKYVTVKRVREVYTKTRTLERG